jgi:hypothetical protein
MHLHTLWHHLTTEAAIQIDPLTLKLNQTTEYPTLALPITSMSARLAIATMIRLGATGNARHHGFSVFGELVTNGLKPPAGPEGKLQIC